MFQNLKIYNAHFWDNRDLSWVSLRTKLEVRQANINLWLPICVISLFVVILYALHEVQIDLQKNNSYQLIIHLYYLS